MDSRRIALAQANRFGEALGTLIAHDKAKGRKISLLWLAKRIGVKSKGYLADVIGGRRTLNLAYLDDVVDVFKLKSIEASLVRLLAIRDADGKDNVELDARITLLKKTLETESRDAAAFFSDLPFAFMAFAAFGLYNNLPSLADLTAYFGERKRERLEQALAYLEQQGLVALEQDRYAIKSTNVVFKDSADGGSHLTFFRDAMKDAAKNVGLWYGRPQDALFDATIISVNYAAYQKALKDFFDRLNEAKAKMETGDADALIRCNVQIYPIRDPGPGAQD